MFVQVATADGMMKAETEFAMISWQEVILLSCFSRILQPDNMSLKPIHLWGQLSGPNPVKVRILLQELNIPFMDDPLDDSGIKQPEFLAVNPNGRLPALLKTARHAATHTARRHPGSKLTNDRPMSISGSRCCLPAFFFV